MKIGVSQQKDIELERYVTLITTISFMISTEPPTLGLLCWNINFLPWSNKK